jgi:hypothetical protein
MREYNHTTGSRTIEGCGSISGRVANKHFSHMAHLTMDFTHHAGLSRIQMRPPSALRRDRLSERILRLVTKEGRDKVDQWLLERHEQRKRELKEVEIN